MASPAYKKLLRDLKSPEAVLVALKTSYLWCDVNQVYYADFRACASALTKLGYSTETVQAFYDRAVKPATKCRFPGCQETIPFRHTRIGCCSVTHYNQTKNGKPNLGDLRYSCALDGHRFKKPESVANHLRCNYGFTDRQLEDYYLQHCSETGEPGACRQCGKPTRFQGLQAGYAEFCYNSSCSVLWYNANTDRLTRSGNGIRASHARGDVVPTQVGYWVKKGLTADEAREKIRKRQTTNSVEAIARRVGVTLAEAQGRRKEITKKWLSSYKKGKWSKVSQELFWEVLRRAGIPGSEVFFATNNNGTRDETENREYKIELAKGYCMPDFYVPGSRKVIEFDGFYWHGLRGQETESPDKRRDAALSKALPGVKLLRVKEKDFYKDREAVIRACLEFLKS